MPSERSVRYFVSTPGNQILLVEEEDVAVQGPVAIPWSRICQFVVAIGVITVPPSLVAAWDASRLPEHPLRSPPPPSAPPALRLAVRNVSFALEESYFVGLHIGGDRDTAELETLVTQTLSTGGVAPRSLAMTETARSSLHLTDDIIHWRVDATVLDADVATLRSFYSSASFANLLVGDAHALGGSHMNSVFRTLEALDVGDVYMKTVTTLSP